MSTRAVAGLLQLDLPSGTIRLSEGGLIKWGSDIFARSDATYGSIQSLNTLREGHESSLEPAEIALAPPSVAGAVALAAPAVQGSRARFWLAVYDITTNVVTGSPVLRFDGVIDEATLNLDGSVDLTLIPGPAMLFERDIGNALSSAFHKSVWTGETGHDQATGLTRRVAWGTNLPGTSGGGSGGGSGGNGGRIGPNVRLD